MALLLRHGCLGQRGALRLIFWGQTHIASGLASPLNATTPLFTVAVAHALTDDEKMTRAKVAARLAGVAVTIGPDVLARSTGDAWGQLACPGAARSYAFAGIYGWGAFAPRASRPSTPRAAR